MSAIQAGTPNGPGQSDDEFAERSIVNTVFDELLGRLISVPADQCEEVIVASLCCYPASALGPGYFEGLCRALFVGCLEQQIGPVTVGQLRALFANPSDTVLKSLSALHRAVDQGEVETALSAFLNSVASELHPLPTRAAADPSSDDSPQAVKRTSVPIRDLLQFITNLSRDDNLVSVAAVVRGFGPTHKADLVLAAAGIEPTVPGRLGGLVRPHREELGSLLEEMDGIPLLETLRAAAKKVAFLEDIVNRFDVPSEIGTVRSALLRLLVALSNCDCE